MRAMGRRTTRKAPRIRLCISSCILDKCYSLINCAAKRYLMLGKNRPTIASYSRDKAICVYVQTHEKDEVHSSWATQLKPCAFSLYALQKSIKLFFIKHFNTKILGLFQLRSWLIAVNNKVGFLGHAASDLTAQRLDAVLRFISGH